VTGNLTEVSQKRTVRVGAEFNSALSGKGGGSAEAGFRFTQQASPLSVTVRSLDLTEKVFDLPGQETWQALG